MNDINESKEIKEVKEPLKANENKEAPKISGVKEVKKPRAPRPQALNRQTYRNAGGKNQHSRPQQNPLAPQKLKLLFTIVNRQKSEFYMDLLQSFDVNMQLAMTAHGTASTEMLNYLGLVDSEKVVILSVIRDDKVGEALSALEEKFATIKNGKGISYTVPMTSTIGVAIYQFLCNNRTESYRS